MRSEFMTERNGKTYVIYAGLLDEAHGQGLRAIDTQLVQIPNDENGNVAICKAIAVTEKGSFTGYGDASPSNVSRAMLTCLIRMAETRAKARALRDAVNVGVVCLEELSTEETPATPAARPAAPVASTAPPAARQAHITPEAGQDPVTQAQRSMIERLAQASGRRVTVDGLTRSQASKVISELRGSAA